VSISTFLDAQEFFSVRRGGFFRNVSEKKWPILDYRTDQLSKR